MCEKRSSLRLGHVSESDEEGQRSELPIDSSRAQEQSWQKSYKFGVCVREHMGQRVGCWPGSPLFTALVTLEVHESWGGRLVGC